MLFFSSRILNADGQLGRFVTMVVDGIKLYLGVFEGCLCVRSRNLYLFHPRPSFVVFTSRAIFLIRTAGENTLCSGLVEAMMRTMKKHIVVCWLFLSSLNFLFLSSFVFSFSFFFSRLCHHFFFVCGYTNNGKIP